MDRNTRLKTLTNTANRWEWQATKNNFGPIPALEARAKWIERGMTLVSLGVFNEFVSAGNARIDSFQQPRLSKDATAYNRATVRHPLEVGSYTPFVEKRKAANAT